MLRVRATFVSVLVALVACPVGNAVAAASAAQFAPGGQQQTPPTTGTPPPRPGGQTPVPGAPGTPVQPVTPTLPPVTARVFAAPAGLLFNTVRPERTADFEMLISYLRAALEKSTDATIREQARGWQMFRATEPGPNNSVLYVFIINPAVKDADYGFGRILADAFPDPAQLQEVWKLYQNSVTGGGSLLNLMPVKSVALEPIPSVTPAPTEVPAPPTAPPLPPPPDSDPNRRPNP